MVALERGQIWWVDFGPALGSEPAYRRPAVIVQSDSFNASRISTVLIAPITSAIRLADAPGNVLLTKRRSGLQRDSVVHVSQTSVIDRSRLTEHHGRLDGATMEKIDRGLRTVFSL